jgi:hypothetical protein
MYCQAGQIVFLMLCTMFSNICISKIFNSCYFLGENDELNETSSVITMTSDERVQIFVPSPQGTPYNTITKSTSSNTTMSIGAANLAPLFVQQRMPTSESYRSLTPLNMAASGSPAREMAKWEATTESTRLQVLLQ